MAGKRKRLKHYIVYRLVVCAGFLIRRMPAHVALSLGASFAVAVYHLVKRRREITMSNLQMVFGGEESQREIKSIAIESYKNLGKSLIEFLRFPLLTEDNIRRNITVQGVEHLKDALKKNGSVAAFIPHFGNHELMAPVFSMLLSRSAAIAFPLKNPYLNDITNKYRSRFGLELIRKHQATKYALRALRTGYTVGFVADQDAGREGVFVEFMGRLASCSRGPVAMALKTGASLHFCIDIRQPDDRHRIIFSRPLELEVTGDFDESVAINTAKLMAELEKYIRQYPGQWMWQHNRWKTQPNYEWQEKRNRRRMTVPD